MAMLAGKHLDASLKYCQMSFIELHRIEQLINKMAEMTVAVNQLAVCVATFVTSPKKARIAWLFARVSAIVVSDCLHFLPPQFVAAVIAASLMKLINGGNVGGYSYPFHVSFEPIYQVDLSIPSNGL